MFYEEKPSSNFRFGDVLRDFLTVCPTIPSMNDANPSIDYDIKIQSNYHVILTPCCSIKDELLNLVPLKCIDPNLLKNEYFKEDITLINKRIEPRKYFSNARWERFTDNEKIIQESKGIGYTELSLFIYTENELLPQYEMKSERYGHYMVDFKEVFSVRCKDIRKIKKEIHVPISTKLLELTPSTRQDLREKLVFFYGREPEEDVQYLT